MKLFIKNKYTKIYARIIIRARRRRIEGYFETHHILPKSCGGSDSVNNLVNLTYKEHFIVHMILPKILKNKKQVNSMIFARECFINGFNKKVHKNYNSRLYSSIKKECSELRRKYWQGENNPGKNPSLETRKRMSLAQKNRVISDETKRKMSISKRGKPLKKNHKLNISKGNISKEKSEVHRRKISEANKGKVLSDSTKRKISEANKGKKHFKLVWYRNKITKEYLRSVGKPSEEWKYVRPNRVPKELKN